MWFLVLAACTPTPETPAPAASAGPAAPWIPSQCYAKSTPEAPRNPCFACHQRGRRPHTLNDSDLQVVYDFPEPARANPWTNLFEDRNPAVWSITDEQIDTWVRADNTPPPDEAWGAHFRFDSDGFDHAPDGTPSGWRSYRSAPFPGFFPTNGNWGDVLIRLPEAYRPDPGTYVLNLAILDAVITRSDVPISATDERAVGVDLDLDGIFGTAERVAFRFSPTDQPMKWVGVENPPPTPGLFPEGTEILHSVRYLDPSAPVKMAKRMKELRYMQKVRWLTMADLASGVAAEEKERAAFPDRLEPFVGDAETGLANGQGWRLRAHIEAEDGSLRPQTVDELATCIGCHGGVGVTTDSVFSYPRKAAWGHGFDHPGGPDPLRADGAGELTTYVRNAGAVDDFAANVEGRAKFFAEGQELSFEDLARDVRVLVLPSASRARELNKAYKVLVDEQAFAHGRDAVFGLDDTQAWREVPPKQPTGVTEVVRPAWMTK